MPPPRFERGTPGLGILCSIHLSYGGQGVELGDLAKSDPAVHTPPNDNTAPVSALKASIDIAPSPTLWTSKDPKGLQYKDNGGTSEGVTKVQLKTGDATKTKVEVSAQGTNLVLPVAATGSTFFNASNVVVQLVNSDGECWTSEFTPADTKKNELDSFKAQTK